MNFLKTSIPLFLSIALVFQSMVVAPVAALQGYGYSAASAAMPSSGHETERGTGGSAAKPQERIAVKPPAAPAVKILSSSKIEFMIARPIAHFYIGDCHEIVRSAFLSFVKEANEELEALCKKVTVRASLRKVYLWKGTNVGDVYNMTLFLVINCEQRPKREQEMIRVIQSCRQLQQSIKIGKISASDFAEAYGVLGCREFIERLGENTETHFPRPEELICLDEEPTK